MPHRYLRLSQIITTSKYDYKNGFIIENCKNVYIWLYTSWLYREDPDVNYIYI